MRCPRGFRGSASLHQPPQLPTPVATPFYNNNLVATTNDWTKLVATFRCVCTVPRASRRSVLQNLEGVTTVVSPLLAPYPHNRSYGDELKSGDFYKISTHRTLYHRNLTQNSVQDPKFWTLGMKASTVGYIGYADDTNPSVTL